MKNLNNYILEKLKINKDSGDYYGKFCRALKIKKSAYATQLFDYYNNPSKCEDKLSPYFKDFELHSSCFDLIFMIAVMLIEDKKDASDILNIGYTSYDGNNDPYALLWFDEEDNNDNTVLNVLQNLYKDTNNNWFKEYFDDFFDIVKKCGEISNDIVWILWDKMETPEEDWSKKSEEEWDGL